MIPTVDIVFVNEVCTPSCASLKLWVLDVNAGINDIDDCISTSVIIVGVIPASWIVA